MTLSDTSELLRILADSSRLRLLALLQIEELTVAELVRVTGLSQSRVSTHLGKLREAGLVHDRRAGNATFYRAHEGGPPGPAGALWEQVRVAAREIFPNCPRGLPVMEQVAPSSYWPSPDAVPKPDWKDRDYIRPILPGGDPHKE